jgi:hypothetical protein
MRWMLQFWLWVGCLFLSGNPSITEPPIEDLDLMVNTSWSIPHGQYLMVNTSWSRTSLHGAELKQLCEKSGFAGAVHLNQS